MNIYSKKQWWKFTLGLSALLIIAISFWYTSGLVNKIAIQEREQVKLWAEAVKKKAELVKYTAELFSKLAEEEKKKVELWAEATKNLANADLNTDYGFLLKVVTGNTTVPVILADAEGNVISHRNIDEGKAKDKEYMKDQIRLMSITNPPIEIQIFENKKNYLYYKNSKLFSELKITLNEIVQSFISEVVVNSASVPVILWNQDRNKLIAAGNIDTLLVAKNTGWNDFIYDMEQQNEPIEVDLGTGEKNLLYYSNSELLIQLKYFPLLQFIIISLFVLIAYWLFSISRNAEQNQVWVGMAKETAHQLGTPLSSLMAWKELLKEEKVSLQIIGEIEKDLDRLNTIAERFSKIGSNPDLVPNDMNSVMSEMVNYFKKRTSNKLVFEQNSNPDAKAYVNVPLFEWAVENLFKNAIDSMEGEGKLTISLQKSGGRILIDICDTGKGIPSNKVKTIFEPGFTTKKRGWGLGLTLTKRIVEEYHKGKVFVLKSELGKGTTFRIELPNS